VPHDAVLLVAFGGPTRPEEIRPFLANVLRRRAVPAERVEEVVRRYEAIGGRSPLNELTFRQAAALAALLAREGPALPVHVGMRNWAPYVADALRDMGASGVRSALAVVLAPHRSDASWERYTAAVDNARRALGSGAPAVDYASPWHAHPLFVEAVASCVVGVLETIPAGRRAAAHLVFTAHSIPVAMANGSPYAAEVAESARLVAERLGHARWSVAYQSRSGNPREPWLEPDIGAALGAIGAAGATDVVVAPIGFACDNLEVLYDLDVEARAIAAQAGLHFVRARTVGDHPTFIRMLAAVVRGAEQGRRDR
jgi:ferrochelatase